MKTYGILFGSIFYISIAILFANCSKPPKGECDLVVCTQESRIFSIVTVNESGVPVIPEKIEITDLQTGAVLKTYTQNIGSNFIIFGDADMHLMPSRNTDYRIGVAAIKNNVQTDYVEMNFRKDCCHVSLIFGTNKMIVHL
jgi:hypothetical protein